MTLRQLRSSSLCSTLGRDAVFNLQIENCTYLLIKCYEARLASSEIESYSLNTQQ